MLRSPFSTWKSFTLSLFILITAAAILGGSIFMTSAHKSASPSPSKHAQRAPEAEIKSFDITQPRAGCCGTNAKADEFSPMTAPEYQDFKLTATYFHVASGLTTTLMLNNKGAEPINATPTIYSMSGGVFHAAPISVPATSYIEVDMQQVLAGAPAAFDEGSMKVGYSGHAQQLGAQIKMVDAAQKLIWAEQFVYTSKFKSSRLENVWYLPFENSDVNVAVSNTTNGSVSLMIAVAGTSPDQSQPAQITLAPWETRMLGIMADLVGHNGHVHDSGGITITHNGAPGAVLARMFVAKPDKGYSSGISFVDPGASVSSRWSGNGLRFRDLDGQKLDPVVSLRNNGAQAAHVTGRMIYTGSDGNVNTIDIRPQTISGGDSSKVDVKSYVNDLPSSVAFGGIELQYDTAPGSVIAAVQSISSDGDHVFQVPTFDPQNLSASAGGFPWKIDGDFRTIVYIKNETDQPQKFITHLVYPGGQYSPGVKEIKPGQTISIDFRELRDNQTPGSLGEHVPLTADTGQIAWSVRGANSKALSARSEQISISGGVASTYSCYNCCPNSTYQTWVAPTYAELSVGQSTSFAPQEIDVSCEYGTFGPFRPNVTGWDTDNTAVANVFDGLVNGDGVGTANISVWWPTVLYFNLGDGYCEEYDDQVLKSVSVAVDPTIQSITPGKGSVGGKIRVSITGTGFTSNTTVSPVAGITFSDYDRSAAPTSISVVFTIAGSATAGNNDVKLIANGRPTNAVSFFVQIPKKAHVDELASTVKVDPGPGNIVGPFGDILASGVCGAYRNVKYTLTDQNGDALNLGTVDENIGLTVTEVLSDIEKNPTSVPTPAAKTTSTNNVAMFGDTQASYQSPPCAPPFSIVLTQGFRVTVGQSAFDLSTTNFIEHTRSGPGLWTIAITNKTP